jgi:hypothetical protein
MFPRNIRPDQAPVSEKHEKSGRMTLPHAKLDERLAQMGQSLRAAIRGLVEPLTGPKPKPTDIGEVLGLDRTQAWRIARLVDGSDPYLALHETPAPKGLSLIIDAAERAGADAASAEEARAAVSALAALIHEFPDGRDGLEAALSRRVPKAADAGAKAARKRVSQGMAQLLGLRAAARYVASIIYPDPDSPATAELAAVAGYKDLRRLREGPAPVVFSGRTYMRAPRAGEPRVLTLDGSDDPDPAARLLGSASDVDASMFTHEQSGQEIRLRLAPDAPPVNKPITLFFGQRLSRVLSTEPDGERQHELIHHVPVLPSDVNVFDTLIHRDLFPHARPPRVTVERFGFNPVVQSSKPDDDAFRADAGAEPIDLGTGLARATVRSVPGLTELLGLTMERIGQRADDFRVLRTRIEYLPPGFSVVVWLPLTESAAGHPV